MEKLLGRLLPSPVKLILARSGETMPARIDRDLVEQALINLVVNARDAMPQGGEIRLSLRRETFHAWPEKAPLKPVPGDYIALRIEDTGTGMPPEVLSHLFEPFFTTKSKGRGTGLGLSTVYGIAKQLDGAILVESRVGLGSAFTLCLPASDEPLDAEGEEEGSAPRHGLGERIAVIESDASVMKLTERILEQGGFKPAPVADPKAIAESSGFDAVVMERSPLGRNGLEIAQDLLRLGRIRGVVLVGGAQVDPNTIAIPAGMAMVPKPYRPADLLAALTRLLYGDGD
jgi:two-component system, cell cycle sensor histidine kinase and response regulator CckA